MGTEHQQQDARDVGTVKKIISGATYITGLAHATLHVNWTLNSQSMLIFQGPYAELPDVSISTRMGSFGELHFKFTTQDDNHATKDMMLQLSLEPVKSLEDILKPPSLQTSDSDEYWSSYTSDEPEPENMLYHAGVHGGIDIHKILLEARGNNVATDESTETRTTFTLESDEWAQGYGYFDNGLESPLNVREHGLFEMD